jgi:hypothetical protein
MGPGKHTESDMKNLFIGNSLAWLRLGAAILVLAMAARMAQPSAGTKNGGRLSKPGSMREW